MNTPEHPPLSEFDLLTAMIEIELVTAELDTIEQVIRSYPKLTGLYQHTTRTLLENPTKYFFDSMNTEIETRKNFPKIANVIYGEET